MVEVKRLPEFDKWFSNIKDKTVRLRLALRLSKVQRGIFGDVKHLQDDVWEMREFFGAGWRLYYMKHNDVVIVMLGGGNKSTQQRDIRIAIQLAKTIEE